MLVFELSGPMLSGTGGVVSTHSRFHFTLYSIAFSLNYDRFCMVKESVKIGQDKGRIIIDAWPIYVPSV